MAKRDQAEEIARAADRITDAVKELTVTLNRFLDEQALDSMNRSLDRLARYDEQNPNRPGGREYRTRGELPEEEAVRIALRATHEVREEMGRGLEPEERLPSPSPEEVRKRREERRKREDAEDRS